MQQQRRSSRILGLVAPGDEGVLLLLSTGTGFAGPGLIPKPVIPLQQYGPSMKSGC